LDAFDSGANDYVEKPFEHQEFMARVKNLIKLKKLTETNSVLQSAIEMKNRFHRMTIHDMKNPLASIMLVTGVMKMNQNLDQSDQESLQMILDSAEVMQNLINDFLQEAQLESGKLMLNKQGIDLNLIAKKVVDTNQFRANVKKQNIHFKPGPEGLCTVNADPVRIREVIDNILSNAIKYTPFEKNINTEISVLINQTGRRVVRLEVHDEGPGFTEEDRMNMFNKFTKLSAIPTGGESSSGLGLSIAKQLVDMHNGRIWAETRVGVGTSFFVELPALATNQ
jgi:signal transduction histidine kinase